METLSSLLLCKEACAACGLVYASEAFAARGRVYPTEAYAAPGRVSTTGVAPVLVFTIEVCAASIDLSTLKAHEMNLDIVFFFSIPTIY
jgi:hypothetical protein